MSTDHQHYVIEGGKPGKARLSILAQVMEPTTFALLQRVGLQSGMSCLDVGCGGGDVTRLLAQLVGDQGRVVGIDLDPEIVRLAAQDANADQLDHVTFQVASVFDFQPEPVFDLVYARFLLTHLPDPARALTTMCQALKPGSVLVVEDIEMSGSFCYPLAGVFERSRELYRATVHRKGADPDIGPKLPGLLLAAGLNEVQVNVVQPAFLNGEGKSMMSLTLKRITSAVLAEELVSATELETLIAELAAFEARPDTLVSLPRMFQAWGTRI